MANVNAMSRKGEIPLHYLCYGISKLITTGATGGSRGSSSGDGNNSNNNLIYNNPKLVSAFNCLDILLSNGSSVLTSTSSGRTVFHCLFRLYYHYH